MFKAYVVVLLLDGPVLLEDKHGPYQTKAECIKRVNGISETLKKSPYPILRFSGWCKLLVHT